MEVKISRRLLARFKRTARELYPKEAYAILLGRNAGDSFFIEELYIPEDQSLVSSDISVCSDGNWTTFVAWWREAQEHAAEHELDLLGDLHTHPYKRGERADASPSDTDWDSWPVNKQIQGILAMWPAGNGLRSRLTWWPAKLEVSCTIEP